MLSIIHSILGALLQECFLTILELRVHDTEYFYRAKTGKYQLKVTKTFPASYIPKDYHYCKSSNKVWLRLNLDLIH